jgi:hypothetical protein
MNCTQQLQCAKLIFFFELNKKIGQKYALSRENTKKKRKYLRNSKNSSTFAPA